MKQFLTFLIPIILVFLASILFVVLAPKYLFPSKAKHEYRIGQNRVEYAVSRYEDTYKIPAKSLEDLGKVRETDFPGILSLQSVSVTEGTSETIFSTPDHLPSLFFTTKLAVYRLTCQLNSGTDQRMTLSVCLILFLLFLLISFLFVYFNQNILAPFRRVSELPYELSKGNLSLPVKETKSRYFGRFLWGMDMLRETLEKNKERELSLQKEKKLLLLSLSHDIKTPLSAIKLYSSALDKNLYQEEEKKHKITKKINEKADEIDSYVSEIVHASKEDFMEFSITETEFYLEPFLSHLKAYYQDKMQLKEVNFFVQSVGNCLVCGDSDRMTEVLQNLLENALKYGDGKRIWLIVEQDSDTVTFHVRNTGSVLPSSEFPHLFDSFFRGSNVKKQPGSGLGLFICRKLIHLMNGEIYVDVETVDNIPVMAFHIILKRS